MISGTSNQVQAFSLRAIANRQNIINELNSGDRCALCCCGLKRRSYQSNRSGRTIQIESTSIHKHICAIALARKDFFSGRDPAKS